MLLAEELALVALDPNSGRPALGTGSLLNACLAGLLVAELLLDGTARAGDRDDAVVLTDRPRPAAKALAGAAEVVAEKGPRVKAILSHMNRGLERHAGAGTWDLALAGLVQAGIVAEARGSLRPHHDLLDPAAQAEVVARLQAAAASDGALDPRTALVLSMTGPAHLLEVVAPHRAGRKHARDRIDHALDSTDLEPFGKIVRKLLAEAAAAGATAAIIAGGAASAG
jgi:hypothetical protein